MRPWVFVAALWAGWVGCWLPGSGRRAAQHVARRGAPWLGAASACAAGRAAMRPCWERSPSLVSRACRRTPPRPLTTVTNPPLPSYLQPQNDSMQVAERDIETLLVRRQYACWLHAARAAWLRAARKTRCQLPGARAVPPPAAALLPAGRRSAPTRLPAHADPNPTWAGL